jgi:hypothetical protein
MRLATEAHFEEGAILDGAVRILVYACHPPTEEFDERPYNLVRRIMIDELPPAVRSTREAFNAAVKRQAAILALDEERALTALPKLLPEGYQRRTALRAVRSAALAQGHLASERQARLRRVEEILEVRQPATSGRPPRNDR